MNKQVKERFVAALRGGAYPQSRSSLRNADGFCCLGVLCDLYDPSGWDGDRYKSCEMFPPEDVREWAGLNYEVEVGYEELKERVAPMGEPISILVDMNDDGASFADIADFVETTL